MNTCKSIKKQGGLEQTSRSNSTFRTWVFYHGGQPEPMTTGHTFTNNPLYNSYLVDSATESCMHGIR